VAVDDTTAAAAAAAALCRGHVFDHTHKTNNGAPPKVPQVKLKYSKVDNLCRGSKRSDRCAFVHNKHSS